MYKVFFNQKPIIPPQLSMNKPLNLLCFFKIHPQEKYCFGFAIKEGEATISLPSEGGKNVGIIFLIFKVIEVLAASFGISKQGNIYSFTQ